MPFSTSIAPVPILPMTPDASVPKDNPLPASGCTSCLSRSMPSPGTADPSDPNDQAVNNDDEDIFRMLDIFEDGDKLFEVGYLFLVWVFFLKMLEAFDVYFSCCYALALLIFCSFYDRIYPLVLPP